MLGVPKHLDLEPLVIYLRLFETLLGGFCVRLVMLLLLEGKSIREVDRHEALWQLDPEEQRHMILAQKYACCDRCMFDLLVELCPKGLNDLFPITVRGQTPSRCAANTVFAV